MDSWRDCYLIALRQRSCVKIQILPLGSTQHDIGQEAWVPPAGEVALEQLCCVSDWPLHTLSWQQSKGGSPTLPAPLSQSPSSRFPVQAPSFTLASHLHPDKNFIVTFLALWLLPPKDIFSFFLNSLLLSQIRFFFFPLFISVALIGLFKPIKNFDSPGFPLLSQFILLKKTYLYLYPSLDWIWNLNTGTAHDFSRAIMFWVPVHTLICPLAYSLTCVCAYWLVVPFYIYQKNDKRSNCSVRTSTLWEVTVSLFDKTHSNPQPGFKFTRIGPNSIKLIKVLVGGGLQMNIRNRWSDYSLYLQYLKPFSKV